MSKIISSFRAYMLFLLILSPLMGAAQAEPLTLKSFEQKAVTAKDEVWVVDFWASWCGPCIQAMPHFKEVVQKYTGKKVRFVSLSWDEKPANWQAAVDRLGMTWEQILLPARQPLPFIDKYFKHKTIPTAFVVGFDGTVKKVSDIYKLEAAIEKALASGS